MRENRISVPQIVKHAKLFVKEIMTSLSKALVGSTVHQPNQVDHQQSYHRLNQQEEEEKYHQEQATGHLGDSWMWKQSVSLFSLEWDLPEAASVAEGEYHLDQEVKEEEHSRPQQEEVEEVAHCPGSVMTHLEEATEEEQHRP